VPARHEARERTSEIVRRRLPHERAPTGSGLHDAEQLERAESLADRSARYLELLCELSLRWKLVPRAQVASFEESLDLLDDALVEAAPADRLDDGQGAYLPTKSLWSGGQTRCLGERTAVGGRRQLAVPD